jgi:type II secretory ATPase GspE/PulE/Tfp pilus assembly ATPase PilB-like protein
VHIEPFEDDLFVRYRIDGVLHDVPTPANIKKFQSSIISRVKIMAEMNIAEKRLPQDGRIQFKVGKDSVDIRVSTLPTLYGESIDLRILPKSQMFFSLEELGLPNACLKSVEKLIKKPHGIILVTGPTGHGKTTTLYACLSKINSRDKKIITVEDPIEYQIKGINQVPVHSKIGMTFANGLRSILRQDPDIIMVGEIRDQETAEIAIRASMTGHLVFSTLHTNDSAGAVTRLIDMGIELYLVSSSIEAILAQRLVRLVCPRCRVEDKNPPLSSFEKGGCKGDLKDIRIYRAGMGCEECRHTGYKGRTGIYELLLLDEDIRKLVLEKTSAGNIRKLALKKGLRTLRNDGLEKVKAGLTTIEEVLRVTQEEEMFG